MSEQLFHILVSHFCRLNINDCRTKEIKLSCALRVPLMARLLQRALIYLVAGVLDSLLGDADLICHLMTHVAPIRAKGTKIKSSLYRTSCVGRFKTEGFFDSLCCISASWSRSAHLKLAARFEVNADRLTNQPWSRSSTTAHNQFPSLEQDSAGSTLDLSQNVCHLRWYSGQV